MTSEISYNTDWMCLSLREKLEDASEYTLRLVRWGGVVQISSVAHVVPLCLICDGGVVRNRDVCLLHLDAPFTVDKEYINAFIHTECLPGPYPRFLGDGWELLETYNDLYRSSMSFKEYLKARLA